jgi:hypothetical protein
MQQLCESLYLIFVMNGGQLCSNNDTIMNVKCYEIHMVPLVLWLWYLADDIYAQDAPYQRWNIAISET